MKRSTGAAPPKVTSKAIGGVVRIVREARGLTQKDLGALIPTDGGQISRLENGANVEVKLYELIARALKFRNALEMFRAGADAETKQLLRYWAALQDDHAGRRDVLEVARARAADVSE